MTHKRLAAIMFSDIVGYTALMGSDEDKAFQVLRKNRNIQQSLISKYHGKWLKEMGDGTLAQFRSATDSVQCAIEIQREARKELGAQIRIGIHLGDVTFENNDVFGDGVNIASRLQSIADPGGIYISESIHNAVRSQKDIKSQYLGEVKLKNVNYPFKTYYIKDKGLPVPSKKRIGELQGIKKTKSIVVLPFDNYTGSTELEYFVAGMHASLIGAIGRLSGMRVISKTTANAFKNTEKSIPEIASELGVDTVIEASVLNLGEKISLQVKLVDAYPEEKQIWIQDYFEDKTQILNLYNTVTKEISNEINVLMTPEEKRLLAESRKVDREVYDAYLKCHQYWDDVSLESLTKAMEFLTSAVNKDPDWAPLYAGLAKVWIGINQMGFESPEIAVPKIYENINRALELDPDHADAHYLNALIAYLAEWQWDKSEKEFLNAIAINPNDAFSRIYYSHLLYILQRPDEAVVQAKLAYQLDPLNPILLTTYAFALLCADDCEAAMVHAEKISDIAPDSFLAYETIGSTALSCGNYDKAFNPIKNTLRTYLGDQFDEKASNELDRIYQKQGFFKAYDIVLNYYDELASKGFLGPGVTAIAYAGGNKVDKALDYLEKGYKIRDPQMPYIASGGYPFKSLYSNPRFKAILKKMNLPLPYIFSGNRKNQV